MKLYITRSSKLSLLAAIFAFSIASARAQVGSILRGSTGAKNIEGNSDSGNCSLSQDGNLLAFVSAASTLVSGDTNNSNDVFLRNISSDTTQRLSVNLENSQEGDNDSGGQVLSYDTRVAIAPNGRYVVYHSRATNLVSGDSNGFTDIFLYDTTLATQQIVSLPNAGLGSSADGDSFEPSISDDGNLIVFKSDATNLVSSDTNSVTDIFLRNVSAGTTTRISVGVGNVQSNGFSGEPEISGDGKFVVFASFADNLVAGDTNGQRDVFLAEIATGQITRVSVSSQGVEADNESHLASISSDGRYVTFASSATNLVSDDTNGFSDVFVYDRQTASTVRVSVGSNGEQGNNDAGASVFDRPVIARDGKNVLFRSNADNLVSGDTNNMEDIFIRNLANGTTARLSQTVDGTAGSSSSYQPCISPDGSTVGFTSLASNLVSGDTNNALDVYIVQRLAVPAPFVPSTKLTEPPAVQVQNKDVTVIMQQFTGINLPKAKSTSLSEVSTLAAKVAKPKLVYEVNLKPISGTKGNLRRRESKRNQVTFRNLPAGTYQAKYRVMIQKAGVTVRKTKFSPVRIVKVVA